jgi:hypothetical protein
VIENSRLRLHRQSAVERERVKRASEAILHILLHVYAIGGRCAVVLGMARAATITARSCRIGRMAVRRSHAGAGSDGFSNLGRRNCVPLVLLGVVRSILHFVWNGDGERVTCLVRHDDMKG